MQFTKEDIEYFYPLDFVIEQDWNSNYFFVKRYETNGENNDCIRAKISLEYDKDELDHRYKWKYKCSTLEIKYKDDEGHYCEPYLVKYFCYQKTMDLVKNQVFENEKTYKKWKKEVILYKIKSISRYTHLKDKKKK